MSDFNAKIIAIDSAMDAIEHFQRENADLRAHITFDVRSLFNRLDQEIIQTRSEIEGIQSQIDILRASMDNYETEEERDPSDSFELDVLYKKLWQKQGTLRDTEELAAHSVSYGTDLLDQFLNVSTSGCDCADDAIRFMGRYIHDLNLVCNRGVISCGAYRAAEGYYVCVVDSSLYPATAEHIRVAQNQGHPTRVTIDRSGATQRRVESLQSTPARSEFDRDEYPMAMFSEGGVGADIAHLEGADNRGAGAFVSWQLRGVPDGAEVRIRVI